MGRSSSVRISNFKGVAVPGRETGWTCFLPPFPFPLVCQGEEKEVRWKRCCLSASCVSTSCLQAMEAGCGIDAADFHKMLATTPAHRDIPKFPVCVIGSRFSLLVVFKTHGELFASDTWGPRSGCHLSLCRYLLPMPWATAKLFLTLLYIWNLW